MPIFYISYGTVFGFLVFCDLLIYVHLYCYMSLCVPYTRSTHIGQKRASDLLELGPQAVVSCHECSGN